MMEIHELTNDDSGAYAFRTSTGSIYRINLDAPRSLLRLASNQTPVPAYEGLEASRLRNDGREIPLLGIVRLRLGERGALWLDIVRDGHTATLRDTSEVLTITRLQGQQGR
ncbi:hypothetical protein AB4Z38_08915 [Arthrobacter sp. 2RAF6]|uniref:hypothetical protein n=1 Tax=Arthrobacter sp. 2RAF6 TaxID=3233002 RepID=UPI003F8EE498